MRESLSLIFALASWATLTAFVVWLLVHNLRTGMTGVPRAWPPRTLYRSKEPIRYWIMWTTHAALAAFMIFMFLYVLYILIGR